MKTLPRLAVPVLAILAVSLGITAFMISKRADDISAQLVEAQNEFDKLKSGHTGAASTDDGLRELLTQQEQANQKLRAEIARLKTNTTAASNSKTEPTPEDRPARGGGASWMERLQRDDPERYKQIVEQRDQRRKAADKWFQDQISALDQTAQTAASQDEAEIASQIADTLAKLNDLRTQWAAIRELPQDQRDEAAQQLQSDTRNAYKSLNDLRTNYQDIQFGKVLADAGVSPKAIQETVAEINKVLKISGELSPPHGGGNWGGAQTSPPPPR